MQPSFNKRLPLLVLTAQAFFLGLATFASYTAANTLFLVNYSTTVMPYVFLITAVLIFGVAYYLTQQGSAWSSAQIALGVALGFTLLYLGVWLGFTLGFGRWLSLSAMVIHYVFGSLGGLALGLLAGQVLDMREMKRLFPVVVGGQSLAVMLGGLLLPVLAGVVGQTQNLLLIAASAMLLFGLPVLAMSRRTRPAPSTASRKPPKSFFRLLKKRYLLVLLTYHGLACMVALLMQFLFVGQAQANFSTPAQLSTFFGSFYSAGWFVSFLFSSLLVGRLLNRFGLRIGLTDKPALIVLLLGAALVSGLLFTPSGPLFFGLIVGLCFFDLSTLNMSITVTRAAYGALSNEEQMLQTLGGPLGFAVAGLCLLLFTAVGAVSQVTVLFFTLALAILSVVAGVWVYRAYGKTLVQTLSRRALGEEGLVLTDQASLAVVERLLYSGDLRQVRLALDLLAQAEHPSLGTALITLAEQPSPEIQAEAFLRIAQHRPASALPAVEAALQRNLPPTTLSAALRALAALTEGEAVEQIFPYIDAAEPAVRLGALVGLLQSGIPGILLAGDRLRTLAAASDPAERALLAQTIGEVGLPYVYRSLLPLLADTDPHVRQAALLAAQKVQHARLLPAIIENLTEPVTRSAAMSALAAHGTLVLPVVERALTGEARYDPQTTRRLVRVCGQLGGEAAVALLKPHISHPDRAVQQQVLSALQRCGYRAAPAERTLLGEHIDRCLQHGVRLLMAQAEITPAPATQSLHTALAEEFAATRHTLFLLLAFCHDAKALLWAEERLVRGASRDRAAALETLDVTLSAPWKPLVLSLVDESKTMEERIKRLNRHFALPTLTSEARLAEILRERETWPQTWTHACAIYAAGKLALHALRPAIAATDVCADPVVGETAAWALTRLTGAPAPVATEPIHPQPSFQLAAVPFNGA
jgi:HEAT repeat protein